MRLLGGAVVVVGAALLLTGCAAVSTGAAATPTSSASAPAPGASPSPTPAAVAWQDPTALTILPSASTPATLPHGPSWTTESGQLACGIYDDTSQYDANGTDLGPHVFYGCRIDAATFDYPAFDNPGQGMIGGCPSGFSAYAGAVPAPLCNSGQVFSSETDRSNVLHPGQGVRFAGIECVATGADEVTCTEPATTHGFRASTSDYAVY